MAREMTRDSLITSSARCSCLIVPTRIPKHAGRAKRVARVRESEGGRERCVWPARRERETTPLGGPSEMNQEHELQQQHHHEAYTLGSPGLSTDRRPDDSPSSEFLNERPKHVQTLARFCVADAGGDRTETFIQEQSCREVIRRGFADWVVRVQCDVLGGYWSRPTTCARTPTHSFARRASLVRQYVRGDWCEAWSSPSRRKRKLARPEIGRAHV